MGGGFVAVSTEVSRAPLLVSADVSPFPANASANIILGIRDEDQLDHSMGFDIPRCCDHPGKTKNHNNKVRWLDKISHTPGLIFYGDSITEYWGRPQESKLFHTAFVERYGGAVALGVSGGTATELLWRLRQGEAPRSVHPPVCVLHIGTNDLRRMRDYCWKEGTRKSCRPNDTIFRRAYAENVYFGVKAVVQELLGLCRRPIVLTSIFPRGRTWPRGPLPEAVMYVNRLLTMLANSTPHLISMIQCPEAVLKSPTGGIDREALPDFLHPSLKGRRAWVECLVPTLDRVLLGR